MTLYQTLQRSCTKGRVIARFNDVVLCTLCQLAFQLLICQSAIQILHNQINDMGDVILALRGDRPTWMDDAQFENRAFAHASDLTRFLKEHTDLEVAGACYPEKHFEAESLDTDIAYLKEKQEAGAAFFITQLFFENDSFYRFLEKKNHAGITLPVCAGIMPITSAKQLGTTVTLSGSSVPKELADIIATYGENPEDMRKAGIDYAIRQILDLKQHGTDGIHIYSMNKPKTTRTIVEAIR